MTGAADRMDHARPDRCRVSVIVPVYNGEGFVCDAVRSALRQTESRIEVVAVDDGSTDRTAIRLAALAQRDPRLQVLHLPRNAGPAAARNAALRIASGTWIATLDADDRFDPARLRRLLDLAAAHEVDMVSDNVLVRPQCAAPYPLIPPRQLTRPRPLPMAEFVLGNASAAAHPVASYGFLQPMIRRDFLARHRLDYDVRNRFGEDFILYMQCLRAGARWWLLPDALYGYAVRSGSLTQVQTAADLRRIEDLDTAMLNDPLLVADPALRRALLLHRRKTRQLQRYRSVTDAVKQRRIPEALRLLAQDRHTPLLVAREAARQLPTITRKALRGGYRGPARQSIVSGTGSEARLQPSVVQPASAAPANACDLPEPSSLTTPPAPSATLRD